jgi:hypothetical protein
MLAAMNAAMISPLAGPRIDTVVTDAATAEPRHRTDYAGTVWYGGRPQMTPGVVVSVGGIAQITTPFWLPDSRLYATDAADEVAVQATAAVQSMMETCQILEVAAALGPNPSGGAGFCVSMAITASARLPLGVAYRVTVVCRPEALAPAA